MCVLIKTYPRLILEASHYVTLFVAKGLPKGGRQGECEM